MVLGYSDFPEDVLNTMSEHTGFLGSAFRALLTNAQPRLGSGPVAEATHTMGKLNDFAGLSRTPERKFRRFTLQYPVRLKIHSADLVAEFEAISRNISICGVLLESSAMIPQHTPVSFVVTVEGGKVHRPIRFVGEGKVVRVGPAAAQRFAIAVECARPISQINTHPLRATGT